MQNRGGCQNGQVAAFDGRDIAHIAPDPEDIRQIMRPVRSSHIRDLKETRRKIVMGAKALS